MNNELIQTLRSIRNTFLLGVLFLGVTAASNVYFAWDTANDNRLQQAARGFRMQADALRYNRLCCMNGHGQLSVVSFDL